MVKQKNQEKGEPLYYIKVHMINQNEGTDQKGSRKTFRNTYFKDILIDNSYVIFWQILITILVTISMSFFIETFTLYQLILIFSMAPLIHNCISIELEGDIYCKYDLFDIEIDLSSIRHEIIHVLIGEKFGNVKKWKIDLIDDTLQCSQEYPNYYINQKYFPQYFFMEIIHLIHDLIRSIFCGAIIHFFEYIKEFFGSVYSIVKIQNKNEG